ncbi:MAG: hypothetical protein JKY34_04985 [Kordiimonadaceae bacterium]|nr:hypothetical protein [Kordiimonadaceae bacterium]
MTRGEKKTPKQPADNGDIVDAEVIIETAEPNEAASVFSTPVDKSAPSKTPTAKTSTSKAGWISATILAAFVGGLFAAPYAQSGLRILGLIAPEEFPRATPTDAVNLRPLEKALDALTAQSLRHREILAQHENTLSSNAKETEQLKTTLSRVSVSNADRNNSISPDGMGAESGALQKLKADIARLTEDITRLATLKTGTAPDITELTSALALLKAENQQIAARFIEVQKELAQVQAGAIDASPRGRLLLSIGQIKERALKGFSFDTELDALRLDIAALSALDQQLIGAEIGVLTAAGAGISTYQKIVADFDAIAVTAIQAAQKEKGGFLTTLFTVRRTDAGATGNDAVFLTAEKRLAIRDIAGAINALNTLEGAALPATADWRNRAQTLVAVEGAFNRVMAAITNSAPTGRGNK